MTFVHQPPQGGKRLLGRNRRRRIETLADSFHWLDDTPPLDNEEARFRDARYITFKTTKVAR